METKYNPANKSVETTLSLGMAKERNGDRMGERILTITTSKYERMISTSASVKMLIKLEGGMNIWQHCFSFAGDKDGDYSARLQREVCPRATEKVLRAYHAKAEPLFDEVVRRAKEHYGLTEQQGVA